MVFNFEQSNYNMSRALIFICFGLLVSTANANSFSAIYVFGDSLSDTGNRTSTSVPYVWPYDQDRASNGLVAVEYLARDLNLTLTPSLHLTTHQGGGNYAVAGAKAHEQGSTDLAPQVTAFLTKHNNRAESTALYILFIGGNDLREATTASITAGQNTIDQSIIVIEQQLQRLLLAGARSILIINAPDVGDIPEARRVAAQNNDPQLTARANSLTRRFNSALTTLVQRLDNDANAIQIFDLYQQVKSISANGASFGLTNTRDACFVLQEVRFHPECLLSQNADAFIFFDEIHPTTRMHRLIATSLATTTNSLVSDRPQQNSSLSINAIIQLLLDN
jgi:phospholipase/lecithinase/hemolysin